MARSARADQEAQDEEVTDLASRSGWRRVLDAPSSLRGFYARQQLQLQLLRGAFGDRFLAFLAVTFFGLKGFGLTLVGTAMLPMFKRIGVSGDSFQLASTVAQTPWAMKGWIGVLSDCIPIRGYHKRDYLVISSIFGTIAGISLVVFSFSMWPLALLLCLVNGCYAVFDLLCEGKYTEMMRERGSGPTAVTFVWSSINLGTLLGSVATLVIVDSYGPTPLVTAALPFLVLASVLTMFGFMPEAKVKGGFRRNMLRIQSQPQLFRLAMYMGVGALLSSAVVPFFSSDTQLLVALVISGVLCYLSLRALPHTLAKSNIYLFIMSIAYVDLSGPLAYYYTADRSCAVDGPGFEYGYYLAITNLCGGIFGIVGSLLFQGIQSYSFQAAFCLTTLVQCVAAFSDVVIVERWNLAFGIPDKVMFLFGDAACQQIAAQLVLMPSVLLNSRLCPRGAEATVYAILASFQNFGQNVASILGVWLVRLLDIHAGPGHAARRHHHHPTEACDFSNLTLAIVIGHVLLPLAALPLTYCLAPAARMDDELAFATVSPPPSFVSPASSRATSPSSSPRMGPLFPGEDDWDVPYDVLPSGEAERKGIVLTLTGLGHEGPVAAGDGH